MSKIDPLSPINASYTGITKLNAHLDKIETALQNTVSRDGSAPNFMEADLDMNSKQIINLSGPLYDHSAVPKSYVDNYFVNALDVQDITLYTPHTLALAFSLSLTVGNYAAARALTNVGVGVAYILQGKATIGDGGHGIFYYDQGSVTADDGGITTLVCGDGRRLKRHRPGNFVSILHHESYTGNGSVDDSAAFAACVATGRPVFFEPGKHTNIGLGTTIGALTNGQYLFTLPNANGLVHSVTQLQTLKVGTTTVLAQDVRQGPGFFWKCPDDRAAWDIVYCRKMVWEHGNRIYNAHQFAILGNVSAPTASYIAEFYGDLNQRAPFIILNSHSGNFTPGELITGGTSGATAYVSSWDDSTNTIVIYNSSQTGFATGENIVGATSGSTGTNVTTAYRPVHLFQCINFAGDFICHGTVEGASDGSADGLHCDSNMQGQTIDECYIGKYFARFRRGVSVQDARMVNAHFDADMEGCLQASLWFYATSATTLSRGWENIEFRIEGGSLGPHAGHCGVLFRTDATSGEFFNVNGTIHMKHLSTGNAWKVQCDSGAGSSINGMNIEVSGICTSTAANHYGVDILSSGSAIKGLNIKSINLWNRGVVAMESGLRIAGTPEGSIGPVVIDGLLNSRITYTTEQTADMLLTQATNGLPSGHYISPDFHITDIPTGAGTAATTRQAGLNRWYPPTSVRVVGIDVYYSAAPTVNTIDVAVYESGVLAAASTQINTSQRQTVNLFASGPTIAKGEYITVSFVTTAGYVSAGVDAIVNLIVVPAGQS
jgi:hypothetical protein